MNILFLLTSVLLQNITFFSSALEDGVGPKKKIFLKDFAWHSNLIYATIILWLASKLVPINWFPAAEEFWFESQIDLFVE